MIVEVETPETKDREAYSYFHLQQVNNKVSQPVSASMHPADHLHMLKAINSLSSDLTTDSRQYHAVGYSSHEDNYSCVSLILPLFNFVSNWERRVTHFELEVLVASSLSHDRLIHELRVQGFGVLVSQVQPVIKFILLILFISFVHLISAIEVWHFGHMVDTIFVNLVSKLFNTHHGAIRLVSVHDFSPAV